MHIVLATMQFGEGYHQGTEKYIQNLTNQLNESGIKVTILAGDPENLYPHVQCNSPVKHQKYSIIKIKTNGWYSIEGSDISEYETLLKQLSPNIVHLVNPAHIGLNIVNVAKKLNIKTVLTITDFWWLCPKSTLITESGELCEGNKKLSVCTKCISATSDSYQKVKSAPLGKTALNLGLKCLLKYKKVNYSWLNRQLIIQQALNEIDYTIFLSKTAEQAILNQYNIKQYAIIPAGLKSIWFEKTQNVNIKNKKTIGFAGAIAPHKGLHILLKALEDIEQSIIIKIAGTCTNTAYKEYLNTFNTKHEIKWLGQLTEEEMINFIDSTDFIVVPSLSPENQPQIILEAHARKKRVICSDVPGASELVHASSTYPKKDHTKLRENITLLLDVNKKDAMISLPTSVNEMTEKTITIYQKVIRGPLCS